MDDNEATDEVELAPQPLENCNNIQAVAQTIRDTFVYLDIPVEMDQVDIYEFYISYTLTTQEAVDFERETGRIFTALATSLNTREFTLKAPVEDTTDQVVITLPREILIDESEPTLWETLKSLFDGGNWRV